MKIILGRILIGVFLITVLTMGYKVYSLTNTVAQQTQALSEYKIESDRLNKEVLNLKANNRLLDAQFKEADLSFKALSSQIRGLDDKNKKAVTEIDKLKKENQDAATLFNTKLPADLKRMLDTATD